MSRRHAFLYSPFSGALAPLAFAVFLVMPGCGTEAPEAPPAAADPTASAAPAPAPAADAPPDTDIWLLELVRDGAALRAAQPRNLTNRTGYDNQPFFTPEGNLLFVQIEGDQTDIWQWRADADLTSRVTATPDQGEYSPTPIPESSGGISYIRSPDATSGRLWRIPQEGAEPEIIFPDIGPVGYHAWFDTEHVALWLLGDAGALQHVELATQAARTIATGVGRSPQPVPNRRAVSFTRATDSGWVVEVYDLDQDRTDTLAQLPEGADYHAWTPDGVLLSAAGSQVLAWRDDSWQTVVDLADLGLTLSRLAVSPDSTRLALVADRVDLLP
jgi:hypothetical protein